MQCNDTNLNQTLFEPRCDCKVNKPRKDEDIHSSDTVSTQKPIDKAKTKMKTPHALDDALRRSRRFVLYAPERSQFAPERQRLVWLYNIMVPLGFLGTLYPENFQQG